MGRRAKYRYLPHTADVKVEAFGKTLEETFAGAADALGDVIRGGLRIERIEERTIGVAGKDREALLYAFLEEFIYLLDAEGFLFSDVGGIRIGDGTLSAVAAGDRAEKYGIVNPVKSPTYNEMVVERASDGWIARFVLDV